MNLFASDTCRIYITRSTSRGVKRHIRYCGGEDREAFLSRCVEQGEHPVYCRRFDNTFDALTHKLMLEHLSVATLDFLIRCYGESGEHSL